MIAETFVGRPDGLGNRIEEIVFLMAKHRRQGTEFEYLWNNMQSNRYDRIYPILIQAPGVKITELFNSRLSRKNNQRLKMDFSQQELFAAARLITPHLHVPTDLLKNTTGVHIRRGDKIRPNPADNEMTHAQSLHAQECALKFVNKNCKKIFVCGDDKIAVERFKQNVNSDIEVLTLYTSSHPEFFDYFCLANCEQIVMASRISSYAITASVIGNCDLHTFFDPDVYPTHIGRYLAREINHREIV